MSVTKRSVSTDALETLGTIIGSDEKRDAIHLAVLPAVAGARLYPGQSITCADGIAHPDPQGLGIVDPFIAGVVQPEQRFWMVLRPRLVTSLRHVWSHPSFPDEPIAGATESPDKIGLKANARSEIQRIADIFGVDPDELISRANDYLDDGEYWVEGGRFEGESLPQEFWEHFTIVTGRVVPDGSRNNFFSCSC